MGHDITALKPGANRERSLQIHRISGPVDDEWRKRYIAYLSETQVASLRFGAFNGASITIYDALESAECNAGCSGCGDIKPFTIKQIVAGIELLRKRGNDHYINVKRKRNAADGIVESLSKAFGKDGISKGPSFTDIEPTIQFLQDCKTWMESNGIESIEIHFG